MEFKIEPLVGCNFLLFEEKRENLRNMLDNKYDKTFKREDKDLYNFFSLVFEDDKLACIEFFPNEKVKVFFENVDINNIKFKEAYNHIKKYDEDIKLIKSWKLAISEKLGIIITGIDDEEFEDENIDCLSVMKKGYITKADFKE